MILNNTMAGKGIFDEEIFHVLRKEVLIVDKDFHIIKSNKAFAIKAGYADQKLVGKNLKDLRIKELPAVSDIFKEDRNFQGVSMQILDKDGHLIHLLLNGITVNNDHTDLALIFWNDITKYSDYERLYISKEIELNTLIYKIAHDLRGPIATIQGLLNLIKVEGTHKKGSNYMELVDQTVNSLDFKVKELSNISDLAMSRQYYFSEVNMHMIIYKSLSDISKKYDVFDIIFDFKVNANHSFCTYEFALMAILYHTWVYAIENKIDNQQLILSLRADITEDNILSINIKDNGRGIGQQYIDKAFSPFFKVNEAFNNSTLSLFTIKKCVDFLNGEITLKSSKGKGTEFQISLPVAKA